MKKKTVKFKKGIHRINFPTHGTDPYEEIRRVEKYYNLPTYRVIGFMVKEYQKTKDYGAFTSKEVFIEK